MSGPLPHLERLFPSLSDSGYSKPSTHDPAYNRFAFAVHDKGQWWENFAVKVYYWPLDSDDPLEDWIRALALNNYKLTDNCDLEDGFEKVAVYVSANGTPEHVARQLESGVWTSKIGRREDIQHPLLVDLEGNEYGEAKVYLTRKRYGK